MTMQEIDALRAVADAAVELRRKLVAKLVHPCPLCGTPSVPQFSSDERMILDAYAEAEKAEAAVLRALREYWKQEGI